MEVIMKNILLPAGNYYKANLHCHSTYSDGHYTVEEIKKIYKEAGYSVIAYSDHNVLIDHSDLNDDDFLAITSTEIDINDERGERSYNHTPCVHLNFFALDPKNDVMPCYNPVYVRNANKVPQKYVGTPDYVRDYRNVNGLTAEFIKNGFIGCVNHVNWSIQDLDDYRNYEGLFAMEIYNHSCYVAGFDEINSHDYDAMLRRGHKIGVTASDDNHDRAERGSEEWDSLGGFTMIHAESLTYDNIMRALQNGDYYASMGPEIYEIYVEDEKLHVISSPVWKVGLSTYGRRTSVCYPTVSPDGRCESVLDVVGLYDRYVRVTLCDNTGKRAWTRAYFDACDMEKGKYEGVPFRK